MTVIDINEVKQIIAETIIDLNRDVNTFRPSGVDVKFYVYACEWGEGKDVIGKVDRVEDAITLAREEMRPTVIEVEY